MVRDEQTNATIGLLSQHFVALLCEYETLNRDGSVHERTMSVYSGFLLELHGLYFWVTAGHCLKDDLDANIATGQMRVVGGGFMDSFGLEPKFRHIIPFTYEPGCGHYIEEPENGLDFALIKLDHLQIKAFAANKLKVISRVNWIYQPQLMFDFYWMLGIPKDGVKIEKRPDGSLDPLICQKLIPVAKIDPADLGEPPPDAIASGDQNWFLGRLRVEDSGDISGMSGGPIYGFRINEEGQLSYHVVALQSRWWDKSQTIFGCSMTVFAEGVYRELAELIEELGLGVEQAASPNPAES